MIFGYKLFKNRTFRVHFTTFIFLLVLFVPLTPSTNIQGKLSHLDKHIKIQASDPGTLVKIFIKEGDKVVKDQILMVLSDFKILTEFTVLNQQLATFLCRESSLYSIINNEKFRYPLLKEGLDPAILNAYCSTEQRLSSNSILNFNEKISSLNSQINNLEKELVGIKDIVEVFSKNYDLQRQIFAKKKNLFDSEFLSNISIMESEKELFESEQRLREKQNDLLTKNDRLIDLRRQLADYKNDFIEKSRSELKNLLNEKDMLTEKIRNVKKIINGFEIRAPQSGLVLTIPKNRVGNIFSNNEILVELVPDAEEIIVLANLSASDNYHISVNQHAVIRLTTHNQSFSPEFEGIVLSISPDIKVEAPNDPPTYQLVISFPCSLECKSSLNLTSGMPVDIYLLGGKRSLISYLLDAIYGSSRSILTD